MANSEVDNILFIWGIGKEWFSKDVPSSFSLINKFEHLHFAAN